MTSALRKALVADGRTLADIARAGNIDKGILSRFMRGQRAPTLDTADRVCEALGVDVRLVRGRSKVRPQRES